MPSMHIHLPKIKGFEFLASLTNPPSIIISSAYQEYALQAFEENVIDSLVKPVRFNRFMKAIFKLSHQIEKPVISSFTDATFTQRPFLFLMQRRNALTATNVEIENKEIPIRRRYKELVSRALEGGSSLLHAKVSFLSISNRF